MDMHRRINPYRHACMHAGKRQTNTHLSVWVAPMTRRLSAWDSSMRTAPSLGETLTKTAPASDVSNLVLEEGGAGRGDDLLAVS